MLRTLTWKASSRNASARLVGTWTRLRLRRARRLWLPSPRAGGESELYWIENKNPEAPAVKREAEEDWGA
jgi:hypothetical protein